MYYPIYGEENGLTTAILQISSISIYRSPLTLTIDNYPARIEGGILLRIP